MAVTFKSLINGTEAAKQAEAKVFDFRKKERTEAEAKAPAGDSFAMADEKKSLKNVEKVASSAEFRAPKFFRS